MALTYRRRGAFQAQQWTGTWKSAVDIVELLANEFCLGEFTQGQVTVNPADPPGVAGGGFLEGSFTTVIAVQNGGGGVSHNLPRMVAGDWVVITGADPATPAYNPVVVPDRDFATYWENLG